jgi:hypothetical protein
MNRVLLRFRGRLAQACPPVEAEGAMEPARADPGVADECVTLPIPVGISIVLLVFHDAESCIDSGADPVEFVRASLASDALNAERSVLSEVFAMGLCEVTDLDRSRITDLPSILQRSNLEERDRRRFAKMTHVYVMTLDDINVSPRNGLHAVMAGANVLAAATGGFVMDPVAMRLMLRVPEPSVCERDRVEDHVEFLSSSESEKSHWSMIVGLKKFGLPELVIRRATAMNAAIHRRVLHAVATRLIEIVDRCQDTGRLLDLSEDIRVELGRETWPIRLRHSTDDGQSGALLHVLPPRTMEGRVEIWWDQLERHLAGTFSSADDGLARGEHPAGIPMEPI